MAYSTTLQYSTPEAQGISSSAIQSFVDAIEQKKLGVHSLILIRNSHIVAEGWWKPYARQLPHSMFSVSKSFTSTAIGLAVAEGRLSVDDAVISFFPSYVTPEIRENMGALQVRHLLSMSTGHAEDTMPALGSGSDDWVQTFLSTPITYAPGTHFLYNTGASFMLSAILQSLVGQTLIEYLRPRLFEPLGIENPTWESNPGGINLGGTGLSIKTLDLAKFGLLYLQRGMWNGQHLVPEAWIEEATTARISNGDDPESDWNQGYGYQFWRCRHHIYRGDGAFGQFCIVMPEQNAVLAITSGTTDMQAILNAVWEYILPGMQTEALWDNAGETQALTERLAHLAIPLPEVSDGTPSIAARIANRTIRLEANELQAKEVSFQFEEDSSIFTVLDDNGARHIIRCGKTDWIIGASALWHLERSSEPVAVAAHGGWVNEHTFAMNWQYIEKPFRHIVVFDFGADEVNVSIRLDLPYWQERHEQVHGELL